MGKQEEERLEMTNGLEGGRTERGVSPAGAQDLPEIGGKGKGWDFSTFESMLKCLPSLGQLF